MSQFSDSQGDFREKRSGTKADFGLNWAPFLGADTIASSDWEVPAGITQDTPSPSNTTQTTTIWLSGGSEGEEYVLTNTITTNGGRTWTRPLRIKVVALVRTAAAFTFDELAALRRAYYQGVTRVLYGVGSDRKEVEYRSLEDMKTLLDEMEEDLGITVSTNKRFTLTSYRRS